MTLFALVIRYTAQVQYVYAFLHLDVNKQRFKQGGFSPSVRRRKAGDMQGRRAPVPGLSWMNCG